jgi:hypothetical protein
MGKLKYHEIMTMKGEVKGAFIKFSIPYWLKLPVRNTNGIKYTHKGFKKFVQFKDRWIAT